MHSLNKLKKYHRGIIKNSVLWAFYGHYSNLAGISKKNWRRMHQRALISNTSILQNITRYRKELQIMNKSRVLNFFLSVYLTFVTNTLVLNFIENINK